MHLDEAERHPSFKQLQSEMKTEGLKPAFVVMQFASSPWNLGSLVAKALFGLRYFAIRADDFADRDDAKHIWTLLRECELILVDLSSRNVNVYMELGAAVAYATGGREGRIPVALIADRAVVTARSRPFDLKGLTIEPYDVSGDAEATAKSVSDAVVNGVVRARKRATLEPLLAGEMIITLGDRAAAERRLFAALPGEVTQVLRDPAAGVLATRYIQWLGKEVDRHLAASAGFPELPPYWFDAQSGETNLDLVDGLDPASPIPVDLRQVALEAVRYLIDVQRNRDVWAGQAPDVGRMSEVDRRVTFTGALLQKGAGRSSAEIEVLASVLSEIAAIPLDAQARYPAAWSDGLRAVRQFTRIRAISVAPTSLRTILRLQASAGDPWDTLQDYQQAHTEPRLRQQHEEQAREDESARLTHISTLGGAYYLPHNIAVIRDAGSLYRDAALRLAETTLPGQGVNVPGGERDSRLKDRRGQRAALADVLAYTEGLRRLQPAFAVEHPFHFRVLLELLSGENRRYPAECILTHEALRLVWPDPLEWKLFTWYRDQLPVVANLLVPSEGAHVQAKRAFVQDYAAFGRTPHTSSFMRVEYPIAANPITERTWWPVALAGVELEVANVPKSVAESLDGLRRQKRLGRIWRGEAIEGDLDWILGECLEWDAAAVDEGRTIHLLQDPIDWPALGFPDLIITELRVAGWIVEALSRYVLSSQDSIEERQQAQTVLEIVALFSRAYLDGHDADGVPGIRASIKRLQGPFESRLAANLGLLNATVDALADTLRQALTDAEASLNYPF